MRKLVIAGALAAAALTLSCSAVLPRSFERQIVIIGFDGLDPDLARRWMREGRLPHLAALAAVGGFYDLETTPSVTSDEAWASFATGTTAGMHNVFDSYQHDPARYRSALPRVTREPARLLFNMVPVGSDTWSTTRRGTSFWTRAGQAGARASILTVPGTFPPEPVPNGELLSGAPLPDIRGTSGTFHYLATDLDLNEERRSAGGSVSRRLAFSNRVAHAVIVGPAHPATGADITVPLTITWNHEARSANIEFSGNAVHLREREWSRWLPIDFPITAIARTRGLLQLFLIRAGTEFQLYVSPINWHPDDPPAPLSSPPSFSAELYDRLGPYRTLGHAALTTALDEGRLDEAAFLDDVDRAFQDRAETILNRLDSGNWDLLVGVIEAPDRVQHVMWRLIDPQHPRYDAELARRYAASIEQTYQQADEFVGEVLRRVADDAVVLVMSDHGFQPFRSTVNVNAWLAQHGYLAHEASGIVWPRTHAYANASGHIFLNVKGREGHGLVAPGPGYDRIVETLRRELSTMVDPRTGLPVVRRVIRSNEVYRGPFAASAPDLIVGFAPGYRALDLNPLDITSPIVQPNMRKWSGDHVSADPASTAGLLITNITLAPDAAPRIIDIAPTVLHLLGLDTPQDVDGIVLRAVAVGNARE